MHEVLAGRAHFAEFRASSFKSSLGGRFGHFTTNAPTATGLLRNMVQKVKRPGLSPKALWQVWELRDLILTSRTTPKPDGEPEGCPSHCCDNTNNFASDERSHVPKISELSERHDHKKQKT